MDILQQRVRRRGDDGARLDQLLRWSIPSFPKPGEGEDRVVGHGEAERGLRFPVLLPLIESVRWNQATVLLQCIPE